ncbi:MAG TPA: glycosyltransferase family 4 protein [Thermoanaerobaculia bacterium]|nr:glycosyltransferase family 4 protein [Thermoanaerobaculia bacterium]
MRICICGAKVPFAHGGAEMLIDSLRDELLARGCEVDVVTLPFHWPNRVELLKSSLAWRLVDLTAAEGKRIDRVIATRFPSYLVKHPNKVVWLVHQLRQVYDLLGTRHSDFSATPRDQRAIEMVRAMDRRTLSEARAVFTISRNVAQRLAQFNNLPAQVLYPPPRLGRALRAGDFGDYVLGTGRLDRMKRFELLVRAVQHAETPVRCRIAGRGPEREALAELAARLGVSARVELLGWVEDRDLVDLYAGALGVFNAPYDEDYGYVTVEAFKAAKPVVTAADSGGVLEFVEDGVSGFVCAPDAPRELAARLDRLFRDRELARRLGAAGQARVRQIDWDHVVAALTS